MPYHSASMGNNGKTCPYCGKEILGGNCQEAYGRNKDKMFRPVICPKCGMEWTIVYCFEGITETSINATHNYKKSCLR